MKLINIISEIKQLSEITPEKLYIITKELYINYYKGGTTEEGGELYDIIVRKYRIEYLPWIKQFSQKEVDNLYFDLLPYFQKHNIK